MANPQTGNGWTMIADEIVEAFGRTGLSPYESGIVWAVIRQTYGWKQKEANISLPKFEELTGILKVNICRTLKKLIGRNILKKKNGKYSLQKDYEKWKGIRSPLFKQIKGVISIDNSIISTDNGESKSPNKTLTNPVPKDTLVKDKLKITTGTDVIDVLFSILNQPEMGAISKEVIEKLIEEKDPDKMIRLANYAKNHATTNLPGYFRKAVKDSPDLPTTEEPEIEPWNQGCTSNGKLVTEKVRKIAFEKFDSQWQLAVQRIVDYYNPEYKDVSRLTTKEKETMLAAIKEWKEIPPLP